jgi:hypothetical protein
MENNFESILNRFPKVRPELSLAQQAIYAKEYSMNRDGTNFMSSLAQKMESWMHRQVAANTKEVSILEVGAGNLNHIKYVDFSKVKIYDVIEPMAFLYHNSEHKNKISNFILI